MIIEVCLMKKKGFTLIEVIVSIVLVSVVLVSLIASLIQLKNTYDVIHENSDVLVYSSSATRVINNDLMSNNGIKFAACSEDGKSCDLILGNDERRRLEITEEEKTLPRVGKEKDTVTHKNVRSTLKYSDTTEYSKTKDESQISMTMSGAPSRVLSSVARCPTTTPRGTLPTPPTGCAVTSR